MTSTQQSVGIAYDLSTTGPNFRTLDLSRSIRRRRGTARQHLCIDEKRAPGNGVRP